MERLVQVRTFAGWGWADTDETPWDFVPDPFVAQVTLGSETWYEKNGSTLRGVVSDPGHALNGFKVLMSPRHDPWDGDVNISLESEAGRTLKGFGSVDLKSFHD